MTAWLIWYGAEHYNEGIKDNTISIFRRLIDDFGFSNDDITKLQKGKDEDINSINRREITVKNMVEVLTEEGFPSVQKVEEK